MNVWAITYKFNDEKRTIIQENDLTTGHVSKSVHDRIAGDIAQASAACQAGRDSEARGLVRASRVRNGYPAS